MSISGTVDTVRLTRSRSKSLISNLPSNRLPSHTPEQKRKKVISSKTKSTVNTKPAVNIRRKKRSSSIMSDEERAAERTRMENEWQRIRDELQRIDQLREEVELLRAQIIPNPANAQNVQQPDPQGQGDRRDNAQNGQQPDQQGQENIRVNDQLVNGLVNHLQYLHINVNIPKFNEETNPLEYLEDLNRYFTFKNVREEHKLIVIESIVEGKMKIWYQIARHTIATFGQFRNAFLEEFYSVPIRVRVKNRWASRRYSWKDGSLHSYFQQQLRETRFFDPPLTPYEINFTIIQQLPQRIRAVLATVNFSETNLITQALTQIDSSQEDMTQDRGREVRNQNNAPNYNNNPNGIENMYLSNELGSNMAGQSNNTYRGRNNGNNASRFNKEQDRPNRYAENYNNNATINYPHNLRVSQLPDVRFPPPNFMPNQRNAGNQVAQRNHTDVNARRNDLN